jgi:alpha/beta hydrolase fold
VLAAALPLAPPAQAADVVCRPDGPARATVLYLHGGGFVLGAASDPYNILVCDELAARGFRARVVDYPLHDLPGAVRAARAAAARHRSPVYAFGDSAGGTLAALLAVRGQVDAGVAFAAPSDLLTWPAEPGWWDRFGATPAERRAASPYRRAGRRGAPLLLMHDPRDIAVPFEQSLRLARRAPRARLVRARAGYLAHVPRQANRRYAMRWLGGCAGAGPARRSASNARAHPASTTIARSAACRKRGTP